MSKDDTKGLTKDQRFQLAMERRRNIRVAINFGGSVAILVTLVLVLWAVTPIAELFAGRETVVNVTIALSVTAVMTGVAAVLGTILKIRGSRMKHLLRHRAALRTAVHDLRKQVKELGQDPAISPEAQRALTDK